MKTTRTMFNICRRVIGLPLLRDMGEIFYSQSVCLHNELHNNYQLLPYFMCKLQVKGYSTIISTSHPKLDEGPVDHGDESSLQDLQPIVYPIQDKVLEDCNNDVSIVSPYLMPTFNFAAYVNKSHTLQELVKLGVDLHRLEKKKGIPQYILQLDFDRDMKAHLIFLHNLGISPENLGTYLTKNPLIFKEELEDLSVRINYLQAKRFTSDMVTRIIDLNPHWLMFSTERIDRRLGHFQKTFGLSGNEVRELVLKQPRLITYNMAHIKLITFVIKEEMGFVDEEIKRLLLKRPRLWMMAQASLQSRFNFVHNVMKIPHNQISLQPQVLGSREFRTKQRHLFLSYLGRSQYDPKVEGYISLEQLVAGTDAEFCSNVAKSSVQALNLFLKTL